MGILGFALLLLFQGSVATTTDQASNWRTYSPPDRSFSVSLPAPLTKVGAFSGEHGAALEPIEGEDNSQVYAAPEGIPEDARFGIVVVKARPFVSQIKRDKAIDYLSWILLGDEDELQFMKPSKKIICNGLVGREYFYIKEPTINSPMFTRGRIFDTGQKIYILIFIGKDAQDLSSADADRFFNSFQLTKHQTKKRKAA
jgi:hypothetical protein